MAVKTDDVPVIECRNVQKTFRSRKGEIQVLKRVDFQAKPGLFAVISGRSGAGKSTLMHIVGGLDTPTSGEVFFKGKPLHRMSGREKCGLRRGKVGFIFQNFNLIESWTALENVEAALLFGNLSRKQRREKAAAVLTEVGLARRLANLPEELSIGEQQRVAVARTMAVDPELVLADEPIGSVDPEAGLAILDQIVRYVRSRNMTLLVATHGYFPVERADVVFRLEDGVLAKAQSLISPDAAINQ